MLAILDPDADRHTLGRAVSAVLVVVAAVLLVPLAALRPFESTAHAAVPTLDVAALKESRRVLDERLAQLNDRLAAVSLSSTTVPLTIPVDRKAAVVVGAKTSLAAPAPRETLPVMYRCTKADVRTNENTYAVHTDDHEPGRPFIEHYSKRYGRCRHVVLAGRVKFTPDERDVAELAPGSRVQLHERTLEWERMLVVTRVDAGSAQPQLMVDGRPVPTEGGIQRQYMVDGRVVPFDAEGRAWVGQLMQDLARESGTDASARVARIKAKGGVSAVLAEIGEIESSTAKRKHYEALLESPGLTPTDVDNILRHAGRELSGSSDLRAVLRHVSRGSGRAIDAALEDAIGRMSDGDKQQVLVGMLDSADTPTLMTVMRLAERIGSDSDKSAFLRRAAPRVLDGRNSVLQDAFFRVYAGIGSDGEKRTVLDAAMKQAPRSSSITRDILRNAAKIGSDGEKAAVLRAVAKNGLLATDALRDEYIKTARTIGSDGEYRAVIDAVLK